MQNENLIRVSKEKVVQLHIQIRFVLVFRANKLCPILFVWNSDKTRFDIDERVQPISTVTIIHCHTETGITM